MTSDAMFVAVAWVTFAFMGGSVAFLVGARVARALGADGWRMFSWSKPSSAEE